jgi:hypothetical protein
MNQDITKTSITTNEGNMKKNRNTHRVLKAHYCKVPRQQAEALLNGFIDICGADSFRANSNFKFLSTIEPAHFDMFDLYMALRFAINAIHDAQDDERMVEVGGRFAACLGPLDEPIAITLIGRRRHDYVIEPQAWVNALH